MKTFISNSLEETSNIAREIIDSLVAGKNHMDSGLRRNDTVMHGNDIGTKDEAMVVGLSGELGAGKTAFVKAVAKHLGIAEVITSPTFVIMKLYPTKHPGWKKLVHIDAYRLESGKEVEALDFDKVISDKNNLVMIEWPENVAEALTGLANYSRILFKVGDTDTTRIITQE